MNFLLSFLVLFVLLPLACSVSPSISVDLDSNVPPSVQLYKNPAAVASLSPAMRSKPVHKPGKYYQNAQETFAAALKAYDVDWLDLQYPQQLTIAWTSPDSISLSYITFKPTPYTAIVYTRNNTNVQIPAKFASFAELNEFTSSASAPVYTVNGTSYGWLEEASRLFYRYVHTIDITGLHPSDKFFYRVGDPINGWMSSNFEFRMPKSGADANSVHQICLFGDFGLLNSQSLAMIQTDIMSGASDFVLHSGDFGYDLSDFFGLVGDLWFSSMQGIMSSVPYMGIQGNHEELFNNSHWTHRFASHNRLGKQSGSNTNWYFSWDFMSGGAKIHMIAVDAELYFQDNQHWPLQNQYEWLLQDLAKAHEADYDWRIMYLHRPFYCSDDDYPDCSGNLIMLRTGNGTGFGLEPLLLKYGIDLVVSAHQHTFERTHPVYNEVVDPNNGPLPNGAVRHVYQNPIYPVHIIAGSAGCQEELDPFDSSSYADWSAFRSSTYGYGHLVIHNATTLYFEQFLDEGQQGKDYFYLIKDKQAKQLKQEAADIALQDEEIQTSRIEMM